MMPGKEIYMDYDNPWDTGQRTQDTGQRIQDYLEFSRLDGMMPGTQQSSYYSGMKYDGLRY